MQLAEWLGLLGKLRLEPALRISRPARPVFFVATPTDTTDTCRRNNCERPRAVLLIDGKRKRSKLCRSHIDRRLRPYLEVPVTRQCQGVNFLGKPCKSFPLVPGRVVAGIEVSGDFCLAHEPALEENGVPGGRSGFGGPQPNAGAPRRPRKTELILKQIEDAANDIVAEMLDIAMSAEKPVVVGNGAHAELEFAPDVQARLAAGRDLLDRLMGKARQTTEIIGGDATGRESKRVPSGPDRARRVAEILSQAQATPNHSGRRRAKPSEPAKAPEEAPS